MRELDQQLDELIEGARLGDSAAAADRERVTKGLTHRIGAAAFAVTAASALATTATKAAAAGGATAGGAAAGGAKVAVSGALVALGAKLGAAVVVGGLAFGGYALLRQPASSSSAAQTQHAPAKKPPAGPPAQVGATVPELAPSAPAALSSVDDSTSAARAPAPSPSDARARPSLEQEVALLQHAQRALRDNKPGRSLALLEEHAQRFPRGGLRQERLAARVMALCALSRAADARREAQSFLRQNPSSPLAANVRSSCGNTPPTMGGR